MIRFHVQFAASDQRFDVTLSNPAFDVRLQFDGDDCFEVHIEGLQQVTIPKDADPYKGAYEVTPRVDEQVLPTAQKLMADDLTVNAIPIYETSNNSGGTTVYIAREAT